MNIAYIRFSIADKNDTGQRENLQVYQIDKWFTEKVSGKSTERPELKKMLGCAREGDTIYIQAFSRLVGSTKDLVGILEFFNNKNISLVSVKENFDTRTPEGKLMLSTIAAIYAFERENFFERQREGIAIAKEQGKYQGRQRINIPDIEEHYKRYMNREVSIAKLSKELRVSRPTIYRLFEMVKREDN